MFKCSGFLLKIRSIFLFLLLFFVLFTAYVSSKQDEVALKWKGEQVFEAGKTYRGLRVGGISELFFDPSSGLILALSDDKENHRFYKLRLETRPYYHFQN